MIKAREKWKAHIKRDGKEQKKANNIIPAFTFFNLNDLICSISVVHMLLKKKNLFSVISAMFATTFKFQKGW